LLLNQTIHGLYIFPCLYCSHIDQVAPQDRKLLGKIVFELWRKIHLGSKSSTYQAWMDLLLMGLGSCLPSGDAFAFEPNHLEIEKATSNWFIHGLYIFPCLYCSHIDQVAPQDRKLLGKIASNVLCRGQLHMRKPFREYNQYPVTTVKG
jgi:hypothetical protein